MSIPKWLVPAALGLALLLGWLYWRSSVADAVKHAQMQAHSDSLDRALASLRANDLLRDRQDSALSDSVALWKRRVNLTAIRRETLTVIAKAEEDTLSRQLPDSLKAAFAQVFAVRDSIDLGYQSELRNMAGVIQADSSRIALRDASKADLEKALDAMTKDRDAWRAAAKPSFLKRLVSRVPSLALGAVIGLGIRR